MRPISCGWPDPTRRPAWSRFGVTFSVAAASLPRHDSSCGCESPMSECIASHCRAANHHTRSGATAGPRRGRRPSHVLLRAARRRALGEIAIIKSTRAWPDCTSSRKACPGLGVTRHCHTTAIGPSTAKLSRATLLRTRPALARPTAPCWALAARRFWKSARCPRTGAGQGGAARPKTKKQRHYASRSAHAQQPRRHHGVHFPLPLACSIPASRLCLYPRALSLGDRRRDR